MSFLRIAQRNTARRLAFQLPILARAQSTSAPQTGVDVVEKQSTEVTTTIPPKEAITADVISGAPAELRHRSVRIFKPTRNTMQSGGAKGEKWRIDFDILQGSGRWENPQMGWASSADYMQGTRLSFRSKEDAIYFAEKQGWDYFVQPETVKRVPPKNYSENYVYKPNTLRIHKTK
ncbi:NADH dehydrogenase Fe-S 4 [Pyrrhoderma noxium]|uniref:NADH dehydrogenase [ubiquinone] iron-sulfur protein 4, mitochondrial n=1 Tax=Pyrrhoderma noxium TaxID=2282107 RepID=A0A286UC95_9AGAM|nr:NADH dehydrogenase Fe-S 4 [Pyrrhoderma noxium]